MPEFTWVEPISIPEAETRAMRLLEEVDAIKVQLGDKNRMIEGRRLSEHEYHQWRAKANRARLSKETEYRRVKAWLKKANTETNKRLRLVAQLAAKLYAQDLLAALPAQAEDLQITAQLLQTALAQLEASGLTLES